jgi:hypothetical protein
MVGFPVAQDNAARKDTGRDIFELYFDVAGTAAKLPVVDEDSHRELLSMSGKSPVPALVGDLVVFH